MPGHDDIPFVFAGAGLDRLAPRRDDPDWLRETLAAARTRFVPVLGQENTIIDGADAPAPLLLDCAAARVLLTQAHCMVLLGSYAGETCFALGLPPDASLPAGKIALTNLRPQLAVLESGVLALLGYARAMVHWHCHNRFCGKCGAPTRSHRAGHELRCTRAECGNVIYPRVNPAIIVLVTYGEHCLLGRQSGWLERRYSTIAGFVEPGEDPEASVRREVREETNIRVASMQYYASQPWPYPASLMLGFRATADNTDIHCNDGELADAHWFSREDIVRGIRDGGLVLPTYRSISYRLVQTWCEESGKYSLDHYPQTETFSGR
ncbi:MAG: NAD(+) diphosphatase [Gammaproteobacteria bacterium]